MSAWQIEDRLEDAFEAVLNAALPAVSTCKTYSQELPAMPYCAILALSSDKIAYAKEANYGACENRTVIITLKISGHSQDMTRTQYAEYVSSIIDAVYTDLIVSDLNTAADQITIQDIDFGRITRGITEHSFETAMEISVDCFAINAPTEEE